MDNEHEMEQLKQELEALRRENERLKQELASLKSFRESSFKEKYAVKILDSFPDMLTVFDHEGRGVEVVSSEETNHVGLPSAALKGMPMSEMVPEDAYRSVFANFQRVVATGKVSTAHHELDVDGAHHYYENRIVPLDEDYVLLMCRDITQRMVAQQSLAVFKSVLDRVSDSILAASTDGTLIYANRQFIDECGITGELGARKMYDLPVSLNTKELFDRRVQQIRDNGGSYAYRAYTRVGDSRMRVQQISACLIKNGNRESVWFFTQDITDVVKKRDELRELNYLMDAILNNIPVYLFVKDPEDGFRYLYWNKAFANHSKIPASQALGHTDFEIFPDREDAVRFRNDDLQLMRTRERMEIQETYVAAGGETRVVQTLKTLVPMEGRAPLLIGISWDITNMQNIEQELVQARIRAEQADRLKTAFLANMSHEIRTPLNAIVGFSRLMTMAETPEDEKMYSEIINENSEVLLQLINDILDLAKIEAGTLEYVRAPMNLGEVCRNIYEIHKDRVQEGVELIWENKDEDLFVNEDKNRIMQVMTNLITNGIKFTSKGEIRFGFGVDGDRVTCYVKDTGMGISRDKVGKVFDRFVKLNSFVQGTGLGLSICRMIVEKLGGEMTVESEEGRGSVFRFTIPYASGREKCACGELADRPRDTDTVPERTILVAEDADSNFLLLKTLTDRHTRLLWAKSGDEAVVLFGEYRPDLVLMDVKIPGMSGLEAIRRIRSCSEEVPVVALTAFAFEADKEKALEVGCNEFLTKPVSLSALEKVLHKYLA